MQFLEEDTSNYISENIDLISEIIEDRVDSELKLMLEGESVKRLLSHMVDDKMASLFQEVKIKTHHSGPGRGRTGRTSHKFSASIPIDLFEQVKSLPGIFSSHLEASLNLYLRIMKMSQNSSIHKVLYRPTTFLE